MLQTSDLPVGDAPAPVLVPHFPDRLHAFVWRNWELVPLERLARVVGTDPTNIQALGRSMGLAGPPAIPAEQERRSKLTVLRRNWHLIPYEQLLTLLEWTPEQLDFTLREDDFLYVKLGSHKPRCEPLRYREPDPATRARAAAIAAILQNEIPEALAPPSEPLFAFIERLSAPPEGPPPAPTGESSFSPRYCYSYFALYGDPLLEPELDPYPDGYLARLAEAGVEGVWLQGVLSKLAPFPWEPERSARWEERLHNLAALVARAGKHGIGIYLYLNEPRTRPLAFFERHLELKGVVTGDHAALCSSHPEVRRYLVEAVAILCRAVPELAGLFTITASENPTNCWSHGRGGECPRCAERGPAAVLAEISQALAEGIREAGCETRIIAWDWGWADDWAEDAIRLLPPEAALQSVSEWDLPIRSGGVESTVGEYSLSAVGPGPRAPRHWQAARERRLKTIAKIQVGNTWELSAVPYVPAVENVARHVANLRDAGVDGLMLGWTLGGCPSPNLEVAAEMGREPAVAPDEALYRVAVRRFGVTLAPAVVRAWKSWSAAFREFPFHIGTVYTAPLQYGPANLLWEAPTGYRATMIGFPYDDLASWRRVYPPDVFIAQLEKAAAGFEAGIEALRQEAGDAASLRHSDFFRRLEDEVRIAEAAAIHFRSVANQARFVRDRDALVAATTPEERERLRRELRETLEDEIALARRLLILQKEDSRLGFEASNQYYYVSLDLAEKVLNCRDLLDRWLPATAVT
jgi:hypothetical protein